MNRLTQYTSGSYVKALCIIDVLSIVLYLLNDIVCSIQLFGFSTDMIWNTLFLIVLGINGSAVWLHPDPAYKNTEQEGIPLLVKTFGTIPFFVSPFFVLFLAGAFFLSANGIISNDLPLSFFVVNVAVHIFYLICTLLVMMMAWAIEYRILHGSEV